MHSRDRYERLAEHFLDDQLSVLGDQAAQIADGVSGVRVSDDGSVVIEGDGKEAVGRLLEEFQDVFGANVERSLRTAARKLDHPVEVPPSFPVDRELQGYAERRSDQGWEVVDELDGVAPQPAVWARLFGFGTTEAPASGFDATPIAERRGVPMDASASVYDAWTEQKRAEEGLKIATGHTWVAAGEIPDQLFANAADDLVGGLNAAKERYGPDRARLIVWLRYAFE